MSKNCYIKFDVPVRNYYGSINAAIVFSRLVYWSRKQPEGFYKFKQPCKKHKLYKVGQSWGEELGMSRKVLDPIMNRLVNHHLTKRSYLKETDKFKGKMFASYTNHKTNQTYYFMDKNAVDAFLDSLAVSKSPSPPLLSASDAPSGVDNRPGVPKNIPLFPSCDVPVAPHFTCAHQTAINTQTITSLGGDVPSRDLGIEEGEEKIISKK